MKKINWEIPKVDRNWAFGSLAKHVIERLDEFEHVFEEKGDINIVMTPVHLPRFEIDKSFILHLDGNRWYEQ